MAALAPTLALSVFSCTRDMASRASSRFDALYSAGAALTASSKSGIEGAAAAAGFGLVFDGAFFAGAGFGLAATDASSSLRATLGERAKATSEDEREQSFSLGLLGGSRRCLLGRRLALALALGSVTPLGGLLWASVRPKAS
jgi:hypothetical protein